MGVDLISKKNFIIDFVFTSIIFGLFFIIGRFTLEYLTPFVLAVFVAYFVQKPASALEKKLGISKGMCAMMLSAALYLLSVALIVFILYR